MFFCSGSGNGESAVLGGVGGVSAAHRGIWGGGQIFFFRGRNVHQETYHQKATKSKKEDTKLHAQYDWTTGARDNGNEWRKFRAVPRLCPCVPLFVHCLIRVEAEGLLDYQGRAGIISIVRWNLRPVIFGVDRLKFRKMPFWAPPEKWPKSQLKCPKSPFLDIVIPQTKMDFLDV